MTKSIAVLPGDGIGPEVTHAAMLVLRAAAAVESLPLSLTEYPFGGAGIEDEGHPLPEETKAACLAADAVFLGAVGGPQWDSEPVRPEAGLLALRQAMGVYANLRPMKLIEGLEEFSPLRPDRLIDADMLIVRELTGGLYFGDREEGQTRATDQLAYSAEEIDRLAHLAFRAARARRGKVTSVDKANVLATSRLWRHRLKEVHKEYPDVTLDHVLVDAMAMHLIQKPAAFDVIVTENLFGDILSDEASILAGSIGLLGSASLGDGTRGLYEPIHGSAPDLAGKGIANPVGAILSVAMMCRHSLGTPRAADRIELATQKVLQTLRPTDLGGNATTWTLAESIAEEVATANAMFFAA